MSAKSAGEKENSRTYAEKRKEERRAALRDFIQGHHLLQEINKDLLRAISDTELPVVKFKTETRLKLLAKVLPDLKAVEITGEGGGPVQHEEVTRPKLTAEEWMLAHGVGTAIRPAK